MQASEPTLKVWPVATRPSIGSAVRGLVNMWQFEHSKPASACVPRVKAPPRSLWRFVHRAVTVSGRGDWECGSWHAGHWMEAWLCTLARHSSVVVLWHLEHRSAFGVTGIGACGWAVWKGPWQGSQVTPSKREGPEGGGGPGGGG